MSWVLTIPCNHEVLSREYPSKMSNGHYSIFNDFIDLPDGTIRKLIGRDLTDKDDPVKVGELTDESLFKDTTLHPISPSFAFRVIDWEQRRYEIASNYTTQMAASFMGNPDVSELSEDQINYAISIFCTSSIKIADELISQLKGGLDV
ncbi:MAG: hypothetical protein SNI70_10785 [Rikenellaceae bacterium]